MKLIEIIERELTDLDDIQNSVGPEKLKCIENDLLFCDEFRAVKELHFIDAPMLDDISSGTRKTMEVKTLKLSNEYNYLMNKYVYLYSLHQTQGIYDINDWSNPVKDNAAISPKWYDPITYNSMKCITLFFSTEAAVDDLIASREMLHDKLDKVLDNPQDYTPKGKRGVMVRGIISDVELDLVPSKYTYVFYMHSTKVEIPRTGTDAYIAPPETIFTMESFKLPIVLMDQYKKEFKKPLEATRQELTEFLEKYQ